MNSCDIDFIKWMCEKAEGFAFLYGKAPFENIMATVVCERHQDIIREKTFKDILYPLLLQRAIEGVNMLSDVWIEILVAPDNGGSIAWKPFMNCKYQLNGDLFLWADQAKESALKYIWEQETK